MKISSIPILCFFSLVFSGCVTSLSVEKSAVPIPMPQGKPGSISVSIIENRPAVLSGAKNETYEGVGRFSYGLPTDMNNFEKKPLADYLADRLAKGFSQAGYTTTKLSLPNGATDRQIKNKVIASPSDRTLIVRLNEWEYDWGGFALNSLKLVYVIDMIVYDKKGNILANRSFSGIDNVPLDPIDSMINSSLKYYQKKFRSFIDDPKIANALKSR